MTWRILHVSDLHFSEPNTVGVHTFLKIEPDVDSPQTESVCLHVWQMNRSDGCHHVWEILGYTNISISGYWIDPVSGWAAFRSCRSQFLDVHTSQNFLHLYRDTVLEKTYPSFWNPMRMRKKFHGWATEADRQKSVCSRKRLGTEVVLICLVILFLTQLVLLSIFVFFVPWGLTHPNVLVTEAPNVNQMAALDSQGISCPSLIRAQRANKSQTHLYVDTLAQKFTGRRHLKAMIDIVPVEDYSTAGSDPFQLPVLLGMSSDVKREGFH